METISVQVQSYLINTFVLSSLHDEPTYKAAELNVTLNRLSTLRFDNNVYVMNCRLIGGYH